MSTLEIVGYIFIGGLISSVIGYIWYKIGYDKAWLRANQEGLQNVVTNIIQNGEFPISSHQRIVGEYQEVEKNWVTITGDPKDDDVSADDIVNGRIGFRK